MNMTQNTSGVSKYVERFFLYFALLCCMIFLDFKKDTVFRVSSEQFHFFRILSHFPGHEQYNSFRKSEKSLQGGVECSWEILTLKVKSTWKTAPILQMLSTI